MIGMHESYTKIISLRNQKAGSRQNQEGSGPVVVGIGHRGALL